MIGIYKITNLINGKMYIGQAKHIEKKDKELAQLIIDTINNYYKEK